MTSQISYTNDLTDPVGELCDIPGLRVRRIEGFPVGWFYFVRPDHADVVRLLSDAQDLPVILADLETN
jgi:toxin ParE1/3/4